MTAEDFAKVQDRDVTVTYLDRKLGKKVKVNGIIRQVYLATNAPNMPGSFDFQVSMLLNKI